MTPARAAVAPIRSGGHALDGILPHPGPARQLLRRHPRRRQRGPAAGGHPGRAAGGRGDPPVAGPAGRGAGRAPARPQAVDPGPLDAGGWGCIDDADVLRCGATSRVLGHRVMAPSAVGTFLRSFTFGHVRQLDRFTEQLLTRAWAAGAGPGDGPMTMDLDSTVCEVHG